MGCIGSLLVALGAVSIHRSGLELRQLLRWRLVPVIKTRVVLVMRSYDKSAHGLFEIASYARIAPRSCIGFRKFDLGFVFLLLSLSEPEELGHMVDRMTEARSLVTSDSVCLFIAAMPRCRGRQCRHCRQQPKPTVAQVTSHQAGLFVTISTRAP